MLLSELVLKDIVLLPKSCILLTALCPLRAVGSCAQCQVVTGADGSQQGTDERPRRLHPAKNGPSADWNCKMSEWLLRVLTLHFQRAIYSFKYQLENTKNVSEIGKLMFLETYKWWIQKEHYSLHHQILHLFVREGWSFAYWVPVLEFTLRFASIFVKWLLCPLHFT